MRISFWYRPSLHPLLWLLLPFSWLFSVAVKTRRWLYQKGWLQVQHFKTPVIVVGNITVGGTGKTPFVIWLANFLKAKGYTPGIVSRGIGGKSHKQAHWVKQSDSAAQVGDEAKLLLQHTQCPVVIGINRPEAVRTLLQQTSCNIIISDDGLQHYRLGREMEIVIVDGKRRMGNGCLLPAGPLREPPERLQKMDFIVVNGGHENDIYTMSYTPCEFISLRQQQKINFVDFPHKKVHAVAGIGHPEQFFQMLERAGIEVIRHIFPDHYLFKARDLIFHDDLPIIMTEKDAVKCKTFADEHYWYLAISVNLNEAFQQQLTTALKQLEVRNAEKTKLISHGDDVVDGVQASMGGDSSSN